MDELEVVTSEENANPGEGDETTATTEGQISELADRVNELATRLAQCEERIGGYDGRFTEYDQRITQREQPGARHWYFKRLNSEIS